MKNLRTAVLCAAMALSATGSYAQEKTNTVPINEPDYNKPKLFAGLPDKIQVSTETLGSLFNTTLGRSASITISEENNFRFNGEVVSSGVKNQYVESVVIRSSNYNGATFSISKTTRADGTVSYRGRIISFKHGDFYNLENENGQYILVKKNYYDLVNE